MNKTIREQYLKNNRKRLTPLPLPDTGKYGAGNRMLKVTVLNNRGIDFLGGELRFYCTATLLIFWKSLLV